MRTPPQIHPPSGSTSIPAPATSSARLGANNIGWINFDTRASQGPHDQQARLSICDNRFRGYAWGENIGWINLDDAVQYVAMGPNCTDGDVACDGVIGLWDFAKFREAIAGPNAPSACTLFDSNGDERIDLFDYGMFQAAFTGEE